MYALPLRNEIHDYNNYLIYYKTNMYSIYKKYNATR